MGELTGACWDGNVAAVRRLLGSGVDVGLFDESDASPLRGAVGGGHAEVAKELLAAGASVDQADAKGRTPLWSASSYGHDDVVRLLLAHGASVDAADRRGWTPLWMAAGNGYLAVVRTLLEAGADVNLGAPLSHAAQFGHVDVVRELLDPRWGADVRLTSMALTLAVACGHLQVASVLRASGGNGGGRWGWSALQRVQDWCRWALGIPASGAVAALETREARLAGMYALLAAMERSGLLTKYLAREVARFL